MRFFPFFLFISGAAFSLQAQTSSSEIAALTKTRIYRAQIGTDLFWSHYRSGSYRDEEGAKFKATVNGMDGGLHLGYDDLQPDAFYIGTEGVIAWGRDHIHKKTSPDPLSVVISCKSCQQNSVHEHQTRLWVHLEQRLGYNVQSTVLTQLTVTPYLGLGWHYEGTSYDHSYWYYTSGGLKTLQRFYENFAFGFDFKVMFAFDIHDRGFISIITTQGKKTFWGFETAIPLRWLMHASGKWDFELKPYLLKLNLNSPQTILGARAVFGYHF